MSTGEGSGCWTVVGSVSASVWRIGVSSSVFSSIIETG